MTGVVRRCRKLLFIILAGNWTWLSALRLGVAASIEHGPVLRKLSCRTVINIGANRGQFALAVRHSIPAAKIVSFEPLTKPAELFRKVFVADKAVSLHVAAVGPTKEHRASSPGAPWPART